VSVRDDSHRNRIPLLIVPGLGDSDAGHWQTLLEKTYPNSRRVVQNDWDHPKRDLWLDRLYRSIDNAPGAILVAHSLGCILVSHALVQRPDLPISGALLVAPADAERRNGQLPDLSEFAPIPRCRFSFPSFVVGSSNDPYISLERARYLADQWGASFINLGPCGHINTASGHGAWPQGHAILSALTHNKISLPLSVAV
jgi:uncharacterized protein